MASLETSAGSVPEEPTEISLGGPIDTPAYFLLDGLLVEDTSKKARVTVPITRLPAVLGRSHETDDTHFFGLGNSMALSRKHVSIYYRDKSGGRVGSKTPSTDELSYQAPKPSSKDSLVGDDKDELPETGFFAIECLGKNKIVVNGQKLEQGSSMALESGASILIANCSLYFLLPTDATPQEHMIKSPGSEAKKKATKQKASAAAAGGGSVTKKPRTSAGTSFQAELDSLPTEDLIERMHQAIETNKWERKHQVTGSTIAYRAVRDAARAPEIQKRSIEGGVPRSVFIGWIETSPLYRRWLKEYTGKLEDRSFQAGLTKALLKAGWTRTAETGRYIKWVLPADIPIDHDAIKQLDQDNEDGHQEEQQDDDDEEEEQQDDDVGGGEDDVDEPMETSMDAPDKPSTADIGATEKEEEPKTEPPEGAGDKEE